MTPERFLAWLHALVLLPGVRTARYYGVLSARHSARSGVVGPGPVVEDEERPLSDTATTDFPAATHAAVPCDGLTAQSPERMSAISAPACLRQ